MKKYLYILMVAILFASCNEKEEPLEVIMVASQNVECSGPEVQSECYLIKKEGDSSWNRYFDYILGFEYEAGFEHKLLVK